MPMGDAMRYLLIFACLFVFLAGCGESEQGLTLDDISGVWENTITHVNSETGQIYEDEGYVVIDPDGSYKSYDYKGDTFDQGASCYDVREVDISPLGEGYFKLSAGVVAINTIHADRVQGGVIITYDDKFMTFLETELTVADFTPLCEDFELYGVIVDGESTVSTITNADIDIDPGYTVLGSLYQEDDTNNDVTGSVYIYAH